ncbi:N-acetylmuramoyl-L-alanine amidase [Bacillus spongiae]|uniref:N-acetylmuramoyl-L-alanine amidase n=1 Tax=Bacillus spongiae TaxID=2683610 RepID=A0ABU8H8H4_9BACI
MRFVFEAGHGLSTAGKRTPDGEKEWSFNNKQLLACQNFLKNYEGVQILRVDDPSGKRDVPLKERTDKSNRFGADAYVSFHNNAVSGAKYGDHEGMETYSYMGRNPKSEKLQKAIHKHLIKATKNKDRGRKEANFHVLRETKCAAVLTESFFMDSKNDIKKLRDDSYLKATGEAIAKGIVECYELKKKSKKPKPDYVGKRAESIYKGSDGLNFYSKATFNKKYRAGVLKYQYGFPKILRKLKVEGANMFEVKNSKGKTYYITASEKYIRVE